MPNNSDAFFSGYDSPGGVPVLDPNQQVQDINPELIQALQDASIDPNAPENIQNPFPVAEQAARESVSHNSTQSGLETIPPSRPVSPLLMAAFNTMGAPPGFGAQANLTPRTPAPAPNLASQEVIPPFEDNKAVSTPSSLSQPAVPENVIPFERVKVEPVEDTGAAEHRKMANEYLFLAQLRGATEAEYMKTKEQSLYDYQENRRKDLIAQQQAADEASKLVHEAMVKTDSEISDAVNKGVDPGRYWHNQNAFSSATSLIAGFAFGYTGKGMDWVSHLEQLAKDDVNLQLRERSDIVTGLRNKKQGYIEAAADVKNKFNDYQTRFNLEMMQRFKTFDLQMEQSKARVKIPEQAAALEQAQASNLEAMGKYAQGANDGAVKNAVEIYKAETARLKQYGNGVGFSDKIVSASTQDKIAAIDTALKALDEMIGSASPGFKGTLGFIAGKINPWSDVSTISALKNEVGPNIAAVLSVGKPSSELVKNTTEDLVDYYSASQAKGGFPRLKRLRDRIRAKRAEYEAMNAGRPLPTGTSGSDQTAEVGVELLNP